MSETPAEKLTTILVVDRDRVRGAGISKQLAVAGARAVHFYYRDGFHSDTVGHAPEQWDLALIHGTDAKLSREQWKDIEKIGRIIYYSGSGGHDSNIPYGAQKIVRAIAVNVAPISEHESRELVRAAREHGYDPSLLLEPVRLPVLRSLSVLTALYLGVQAACAEPGTNLPGGAWSPVSPAILRSMGWTRLPETLRQQLCNQQDGLPSHLNEVRRASWWLQRLPVHQGPELETALEKELTLLKARSDAKTDAVRALVAEVRDDQSSAIGIDLVASCYQVLAELPEL